MDVPDLPDISGQLYDLSRISHEDLEDYNITQSYVFYMQGADVVFPGTFPIAQGSIRMYFYLQPSALVSDDEAGVISGIDTATGIITLSNFPTTFSGATLIDFVQATSPNKIRDWDISVVSTDSAVLQITVDPDDLPDNLAVGDYINLTGESIVPQLPTEMHPLLAESVAVAALEALGDAQNYQIATLRYEKMRENVMRLIDDRVEGSPRKIRPRYSPLHDAIGGNNRYRRGSYNS